MNEAVVRALSEFDRMQLAQKATIWNVLLAGIVLGGVVGAIAIGIGFAIAGVFG